MSEERSGAHRCACRRSATRCWRSSSASCSADTTPTNCLPLLLLLVALEAEAEPPGTQRKGSAPSCSSLSTCASRPRAAHAISSVTPLALCVASTAQADTMLTHMLQPAAFSPVHQVRIRAQRPRRVEYTLYILVLYFDYLCNSIPTNGAMQWRFTCVLRASTSKL